MPQRRLDARVRNYGGDLFVAGPEQGVQLSESGSLLWRWMDGTRSVGDITGLLRDHYGIDEETAVTDVRDLVHQLADLGALTY